MGELNYLNSLQYGEEQFFVRILLQPALILKRIGFKLDELELINNKNYIIRKVKENSLSDYAGLKTGDRIVKINNKETEGMNYINFCNEILIVKENFELNHLLKLMVFRKPSIDNKTTTQKSKKLSKKYNLMNQKCYNYFELNNKNSRIQQKLFNIKIYGKKEIQD
jgi:C-terminal processing protease CtpA/Prc